MLDDDVNTQTSDSNAEFPLDPSLKSPVQELLAGSESPLFLPSLSGLDTQSETQAESSTTTSTPELTPTVSRNRSIGPPPRKRRKEAPLDEGLAGLKATLDRGNELLNKAIAVQEKAQESEVKKAISTLVKVYKEQDIKWIAKAMKVLKYEASAHLFNCLEETARNSFIMAEIE